MAGPLAAVGAALVGAAARVGGRRMIGVALTKVTMKSDSPQRDDKEDKGGGSGMNPDAIPPGSAGAYQFRVVPEDGGGTTFGSDFAALAFEGDESQDESDGDEDDSPDPEDDVTVQPADSVLNPTFTEEWVGDGSDNDDVGDVVLDRELYSADFQNMAAFSDVPAANDDETSNGGDLMVV